jgi:hypothetical protein
MNRRKALILVIAILETVLLFFVAILSNKISNVLAITPKVTLLFAVVGLTLLSILSYIKSTDASSSQASGIENETLLNRPGSETETFEVHQPDEPSHGMDSKQEERASNQFMLGGIIVGAVLTWGAVAAYKETESVRFLLIWLFALIGSLWYSSYPTWRLASSDKDWGVVWKYILIPTLVYCYSFWIAMFFIAVLLIGWGLFSLLRWVTSG